MLHILTNRYRIVDPCFERSPKPAVELDLGCGKGGFLLQLAERYPGRVVVGADLMLGRLRRLADKVARRGLANVELLRASSLELADHQMPDSCIDRLHLLCPDPWPKSRHRGKRLLNAEFMARVVRILKPNGVFHFSTDAEDYLNAAADLLAALPRFRPEPAAVGDIADLQTDFERQWLAAARRVPHLAFVLDKTRSEVAVCDGGSSRKSVSLRGLRRLTF